jgi:hypothetical protein
MKYIKQYENEKNYEFKKYFLLKDFNGETHDISEYISSFVIVIKLTYIKTKILYYIKNNEIIEPNPYIVTTPQMSAQTLKERIIFQSDNLQDVIDYLEFTKNVNNYNL